tara:strand:+ start:2952 stop:3182 length:231 start_codon:yes stop_codon:yes gene_type:complete
MKGDNMEEELSIINRVVKRAITFEQSMANIEINSLKTQLKFYEGKFKSLFAFVNEKEPALAGIWMAERAKKEAEEE